MPEKLYTKLQAAEYLQCSLSTINRRIKAGQLQTVKNGRIVRVTESELEKFLQTPATDAPTQPTESHTTGEKATHETDTQHPDDTTDEPLSVSEWSGINGRTAPLPDS